MAYASADRPQRNATTLALVAIIHVGAGLALINGLAGGIFTPPKEKPFEGFFVPTKSDPLPPPPPQDRKPDQTALVDNPLPQPLPPVIPGPVIIDPVVPTFELTGGTGGVGEATFPQDPPPPPPAFAPKGAKARGNTGLWVTPADYPGRELRDGREGITRARLAISAAGKVTGCEVIGTSGWPALDQAACRKLTDRARFDPATDEAGAAVPGSYTTSVRWQIPRE